MLNDKNKRTNIDLFYVGMILFVAAIIIVPSIIIFSSVGEHQKFIDKLDDMSCSELLTEIKDDHPQREGYGYLETWVEKECYRN